MRRSSARRGRDGSGRVRGLALAAAVASASAASMMSAAIVGAQDSWALTAVVDATVPDAPDPSVAAFFQDCPASTRIVIHHNTSAWDVHAIAYAASNLMELEVVRLLDWAIDLPLPGVELRPIERSIGGVRSGYGRLGHSLPVRRVGELVDALQLPELSLGDVASTYGATGVTDVNPGSGTLVRVNKLIDWTQHIVGDLNRGVGWPVGRRDGMIGWRGPAQGVDLFQKGVTRGFHWVSVLVARSIDRGLLGAEHGLEAAVNAPRSEPHADTSVFLRMPIEVYRAHEPWMRRHRRRLYVGTAEDLSGLTHAQLFHRRGRRGAEPDWGNIRRLSSEPSEVVVIAERSAFDGAPPPLRPYVVPAAWVLSQGAASETLMIH
jgi:hypothetical protein